MQEHLRLGGGGVVEREGVQAKFTDLPSKQEKIHAHCFVSRPELRIQYTYTYANNSEHHRFGMRYTYLALFTLIYLVRDTHTHT